MRPVILPSSFRAVVLETVDSTNEEAKRQAGRGADHGTVIVAAEQTAGRGRRGREWVSQKGNLHCSLLLRTGRSLTDSAQLSFAAGIALVEALRLTCPGLPVACKWPNDALSNGHKLSGMLLEAVGDGSLIILGLGVNIVHAPSGMMYPTLSLAEAGYEVTAETFLESFCDCFWPWFSLWQKEGFSALRQPWLDRACGLGEPVTVRLDDQVQEGYFAGLGENGALLLEGSDGTCRSILAGDIFFPGS